MKAAANIRVGLLLPALLAAAACGSSLTSRQRYLRALQQKLDGDAKGYYDAMVGLAHQEPSSRAGRRARATLQGQDPLLQLAIAAAAGTLGRQVVGAMHTEALQREARTVLRTLAGALQAHHAATGRYCQGFAECGVTAAADSRFVYFLGRDQMAGGEQLEEAQQLRRRALALAETMGIVPRVSAEGFTVVAVGNLDGDDALDVWLVDHRGNLVHVLDDGAQ